MSTIYTITTEVTGKMYVGQTSYDIQEVFSNHLSQLKRGQHRCKPLQALFHEGVNFSVVDGDYESLIRSARQARKLLNLRTRSNPPRKRSGKPCEWNGVTYPSIKEASLATGIHYKTLQHYVDFGILGDEMNFKGTFQPQLRPFTWNGVTYPSLAEASRSTGMSYNRIRLLANRGITSTEEQNEAFATGRLSQFRS